MKKSLTALTLASLKPAEKPYYVGDAKQDGLRVRVGVDGHLTWNVTVRIKHGKILSSSLGVCDPDGKQGLDLSTARARAATIIKAARQGIDLIAVEKSERAARDRQTSVSDLIDKYASDISNPNRKGGALRTAKEIERRLRRLMSVKLNHGLAEVSRRDMSVLLDEVAATFPREAEKRRQVSDAMFKWAVAKGYCEANPLAGLPAYGSGNPRDRVLTSEELKKLWFWLDDGADQMPPDVIVVIKLQIVTGARVGEISGMHAGELLDEGERFLWTLPAERSKNKNAHTRPLIGYAADSVRKQLKKWPSGPLFRTLDGGRALRSDDIGLALNHRERPIAHFTTHDIRRTFVSRLDELGVPLDDIAAAIGHRRGSVETRTLVRHYSRPNLDVRVMNAIVTWDAHLMTLLGS